MVTVRDDNRQHSLPLHSPPTPVVTPLCMLPIYSLKKKKKTLRGPHLTDEETEAQTGNQGQG